MENRTFNAIGVITLLTMLPLTSFNFVLGYYTLGLISVFMILLLTFLLYLSRFRRKFKLAALIYAILSYVLLSANYFLNAGKAGPTIYGFFLTFLLIIVISPRRWHVIWIFAHILTVAALFTIEYLHPEWILNQYEEVDIQFLDLSMTYVTVIIIIYITASYLRRNYKAEKQLAENRAKDIEKSNVTISDQNARLKELNSEKNRLFSIIAHDLRNPLSAIQGYLETINSSEISEDDRKLLESELLGLTRNTSWMLNNLLHWSGNQMKGSNVNLRRVNVSAAVDEVLKVLSPIAEKKSIQINDRIKKDVHVKADPDMLELVIRNLINNAIKFTPSGGKVDVYIENKGKEICICIKDSGVGIAPEKQELIFTTKASSSPGTQREGGIGLGLVLCYDFVKMMKGDIRFKSIPHKGTCFVLSLKNDEPEPAGIFRYRKKN